MTILEIKSKIVEWIKTGIPSNVKSSNLRTLLSKLTIRVDVQEVGRLKVIKVTGNTSESQEVGDRVTGIVEDTLIVNHIYLGANINLLINYFNPDTQNPTQNNYTDINEMFAGQEDQTKGYLQEVADASDDPDVSSGKAIYIYLGSTNGDLTDYLRLSDEPVSTTFPIITIGGRPFELRKTVNLDDPSKKNTLEVLDVIFGTPEAGSMKMLRYEGGDNTDFENNYTPITGI